MTQWSFYNKLDIAEQRINMLDHTSEAAFFERQRNFVGRRYMDRVRSNKHLIGEREDRKGKYLKKLWLGIFQNLQMLKLLKFQKPT